MAGRSNLIVQRLDGMYLVGGYNQVGVRHLQEHHSTQEAAEALVDHEGTQVFEFFTDVLRSCDESLIFIWTNGQWLEV